MPLRLASGVRGCLVAGAFGIVPTASQSSMRAVGYWFSSLPSPIADAAETASTLRLFWVVGLFKRPALLLPGL